MDLFFLWQAFVTIADKVTTSENSHPELFGQVFIFAAISDLASAQFQSLPRHLALPIHLAH